MSVLNPSAAFAKGMFGLKVARATDTLPQTGSESLFTISGGRVAVTAIIGEVTTVIQTQANNTKLVHNPTDAGTSQDLCAVLDISADAVGTMYTITGTPGTTMQDSLNLIHGNEMLTRPVILKAGVIELNTAASNTGSVKWDIWYVPLDDGAAIEAA